MLTASDYVQMKTADVVLHTACTYGKRRETPYVLVIYEYGRSPSAACSIYDSVARCRFHTVSARLPKHRFRFSPEEIHIIRSYEAESVCYFIRL